MGTFLFSFCSNVLYCTLIPGRFLRERSSFRHKDGRIFKVPKWDDRMQQEIENGCEDALYRILMASLMMITCEILPSWILRLSNVSVHNR